MKINKKKSTQKSTQENQVNYSSSWMFCQGKGKYITLLLVVMIIYYLFSWQMVVC